MKSLRLTLSGLSLIPAMAFLLSPGAAVAADLLVVPLRPGDTPAFVELQVPPAITIRDVSHDGVIDQAARTVHWGPLDPSLTALIVTLDGAAGGETVFLAGAPSDTVDDKTLTLPVDQDDDGLPAAFENTHGLDDRQPDDAHRDLDGDGVSNLTEFLADTDPADPTSQPRLGSASMTNDGRALLMDFPQGRSDVLQVETAIRLDGEAEWQTVAGWEIIDGQTRRLRIPLTQSPSAERVVHSSQRFYRLRWHR